MIGAFTSLLLCLWTSICRGQFHPAKGPEYQRLPSLKGQALIQDTWTAERIKNIPNLLQKYDVDAWLISQLEITEETVFWSLKSATEFSARGRTLMLFCRNASYTWVDRTDALWQDVSAALEYHAPSSIAVNTNSEIVFGGGLHAGELFKITKNLDAKWVSKFKDIPMLGVEYVATRVDSQLEWYRKLQETAWTMVSEAFSEKAVVPGVTTSHDLSWWFRDKMQTLNYSTWNMPRVSVVLPDSFPGNDLPVERIIDYGDMLHVDFGVTALGLNTDTQHLGFVLRPGETESDIPSGFIEGLKKSNRMQEIVRANMRPGVSGNQVLHECLEQMKEEGIEGRIYCHPIGDWGHSAGSVIGMTNLQDTVPIFGDLPLLPNTYYSIELYAEHFVEERNATFRFMQEENVYWNDESKGWEYVFARQERFHLVQSQASSIINPNFVAQHV